MLLVNEKNEDCGWVYFKKLIFIENQDTICDLEWNNLSYLVVPSLTFS